MTTGKWMLCQERKAKVGADRKPVIDPDHPDRALIPLSQGRFAIIDTEDIPLIEGYT
jgi:hypothetical protein